ncbi:FAD-binding domain-containing protein [Ferruginibacter sp. SUN106]|uniref:FAD-binding domain-containing protein n=1 Tax=Ferruginibacter sp. SUN106 TaxID=2978348 RepID=UPI003D35B908
MQASSQSPRRKFVTDYGLVLEKVDQVDPLSYARTRNFINGAVTYLSPYISRGVISTLQVKEAVLKRGYTLYEIEKLLRELAWREYYQRVWQATKDLIWQDLRQPQPDTLHHEMISALQNAATGIHTIDDQVNNLYTTGYMHNHTRMYVAAIACNIAKAHWLQPSKWLYYHLLDGDIASNNCSWQWVAGAFAAKKYYCNQENINRYTLSGQQHTFLDKPYETIAAIPVPDRLMETCALQLQTVLPQTAVPVIDCTKPTLLYNAYNIDPQWRKTDNVNRVLLLEPSHFSRYPVSEKVISFIIDLSRNIAGIQVYCGELSALQALYNETNHSASPAFIAKEHPAFTHYPGIKDSRDWLFPSVTGFYPSYSAYWKHCERYLK